MSLLQPRPEERPGQVIYQVPIIYALSPPIRVMNCAQFPTVRHSYTNLTSTMLQKKGLRDIKKKRIRRIKNKYNIIII